MKEQDLKTLQQLANEVMTEYPGGLMLDGEGNFREEEFVNGVPSGTRIVGPHVVLRRIHLAGDVVQQLCAAIGAIKGRKKPGDANE